VHDSGLRGDARLVLPEIAAGGAVQNTTSVGPKSGWFDLPIGGACGEVVFKINAGLSFDDAGQAATKTMSASADATATSSCAP